MTRLLDVVTRVARQRDGAPQGVLFGLVSGIEKDGRVTLTLPSLGDIGTDLTRIVLPVAGHGRAMSFTPQLNDQAIVAFVNGDWRTPVVLGFIPSKADPLPREFTNGQCGITLGADKPAMTLNETKNDGGPGLTITDGSGNSITIRTNGNTIEITAAGNIVLSAPKGKVSISASSIELNATGKTSITGAELEVIGKQNALTLKGNPVNINC
jgi:phage baseplate assembly protein gpV